VATFLAIDSNKKEVDRMMDECGLELKKMQSLLESAEPKALKDFFRKEMETDPDLRARWVFRKSILNITFLKGLTSI
jgi:hypothetical protein